MRYDFYAEHAVESKEQVEAVAKFKGRASFLKKMPWTLKAQTLNTGIALDRELKKIIQTGKDAYPNVLQDKVLKAEHVDVKDIRELRSIFLPTEGQEGLKGLPLGSCLITGDLQLTRPFYSRDDRDFYPMDNPLKREWVFQTPYLAASGVKGLLRWAWQACFAAEKRVEEIRLFGSRPGLQDEADAHQGVLHVWPVFWDPQVGLEVINPQDRTTGAGSDPVRYEVVQAGATGKVCLLILNRTLEENFLKKILPDLLQCLQMFLQGGLSAKRSADWGTVKSLKWQAWVKTPPPEPAEKEPEQAPPEADPKEDVWALLTEDDQLKDFSDPVYTNKRLALLTGRSEKKVKKGMDREKTFQRVQDLFEERKQLQAKQESQADEPDAKPDTVREHIVSVQGDSFEKWKERLTQRVKEGL